MQRSGNREQSIRFATRADIPEIVRVINLAYRVEDFFVNGDRTNALDVETRMTDLSARVLVVDADRHGALAAAVFVDVHDGRGHFAMLSVDPAFQGQGLGRLLISAVEKHCLGAGCHSLDLEVVNLREELPPFYEVFGFTESGTVPFTPESKLRRQAHLVRMTKSLTTGHA